MLLGGLSGCFGAVVGAPRAPDVLGLWWAGHCGSAVDATTSVPVWFGCQTTRQLSGFGSSKKTKFSYGFSRVSLYL